MLVGDRPHAVFTQERLKGGTEIAGGQPAQVENGQHFGDLGRTAHVRRQDLAGEASALAVLIVAAVIDSWRSQLHGSRAERELARLALAVAYH